MLQGTHHPLHKKPVTAYDHFMYVVAVISPFVTVPQFLDVWTRRNVEGLSLFTWGAYSIVAFLWLFYWKEHNKLWIFFGHIIILLLNLGIVAAIILYS